MSPTLYTAKNNGKKNNGGNMTIRISMTMANNRIGMERLQSAFPGFHCGIVSETYGNIGAEKQMKLIRKKVIYQQCGGTYKALHRWNVSRIMRQRYSVREVGQ